MKLVSILIFNCQEDSTGEVKAHLLYKHVDLSSFSFFIRSSLNQIVLFHSRLICARIEAQKRVSVNCDHGVTCHAFKHMSGLAASVIASQDYPEEAAFSLLNRVLNSFISKYPIHIITQKKTDVELDFVEGAALLNKFQNPMEADTTLQIKGLIDEVQDDLRVALDNILKRGETIDSLVSKTNDLSAACEKFYRKAKSQNQCCKWY